MVITRDRDAIETTDHVRINARCRGWDSPITAQNDLIAGSAPERVDLGPMAETALSDVAVPAPSGDQNPYATVISDPSLPAESLAPVYRYGSILRLLEKRWIVRAVPAFQTPPETRERSRIIVLTARMAATAGTGFTIVILGQIENQCQVIHPGPMRGDRSLDPLFSTG